MTHRARILWTLLATLLALLVTDSSRAASSGKDVLTKVDRAQSQYTSLMLTYDVVTHESGRGDLHMKIRTRFKGDKQFTEFLAPGDVKGTRVLHLSDTKMYIYLPAFRKVRRVASHVNEQGMMGTTFSGRDMHITQYGGYYDADVLSEDGGSWILRLRARSDSHAPYPKLELTVSKKLELPTEIKYFNDQGKHVKTETRWEFFCEDKVCLARHQRMTDHTKGDKYSQVNLRDYEINPSIPDKLFSKRSLRP